MQIDLVKQFTEPCTYIQCDEGWIGPKTSHWNRCYRCKGTGRILNQDGEAFLKFLRDYGDFAEKDHTHYVT